MAAPAADRAPRLLGAFNFRVTLRGSDGGSGSGDLLGDGGFQEVTGLEVEMDVQEHREGGRNDGLVRLVGRGSQPVLVLKRGMFATGEGSATPELWTWIQDVLSGVRPVRRYDGLVEVLDGAGGSGGSVLATWSFVRGLPAKVVGPRLDARSGQIAVEELHIAHEGLRLEG